MIVRIVRLHIHHEKSAEFLRHFELNRKSISRFPGCIRLEIFEDADDPDCFITQSYWTDAKNLDSYRSSILFKKVWGEVKPLFSRQAEAFTMKQHIEA